MSEQLLGGMQHWPLTVDKIIEHAARWHSDREVVTRSLEGPIVRTNYGDICRRAKQFTNALRSLGVQQGDRVATLAWNTARHLEAWYGIMGMGAVCHTVNPRLFKEQICYIIRHARDKVVLTDRDFLPLLMEHVPDLPSIEHVIVLTDEPHMPTYKGTLCYETLIAAQSQECVWGGFDENIAAGLCYTSGTTGDPKGVLYSHRSNFIHTLVGLGADVLGLHASDTILPIVPLYHANAWGLAFSAPAAGAKIVMPGSKLDSASLYELMEGEGVTHATAVPTIWSELLAFLRETGKKPSTLRRALTGGAAISETVIRAFRDEYAIEVSHGWGMTEMSPLGSVATFEAHVSAMSAEEQLTYAAKQGRPPLTVEMRIVDEQGQELPHDGKSIGALQVRGATVVESYFESPTSALNTDGFFDTGDIATIDRYGYMQITDRAKDIIKSGGEWISSIEIENLALKHPSAQLCAVIGVPHPKWNERPVLLVKLRSGYTASAEEFREILSGKIAKWWMPDEIVFVDDIPLGPTGKIDKKRARIMYGSR